MDPKLVSVSKFLSLVLRHQPGKIGLSLDENGWADIGELLRLAAERGKRIDRATLDQVVRENDKKRFAVSPDGLRIRASQGHSIEIDLDLPPSAPPEELFHGTAERNLESIRSGGLIPGSRRHVHLSLNIETATAVGMRHGRPAVLRVRAGEMAREGLVFYVSENGVWLTEAVPPRFLEFPGD